MFIACYLTTNGFEADVVISEVIERPYGAPVVRPLVRATEPDCLRHAADASNALCFASSLLYELAGSAGEGEWTPGQLTLDLELSLPEPPNPFDH